MPLTQYEASVITAAIGAVPAIGALVRDLFVKQNPGSPSPTDADVIAALQTWGVFSLAVDEAWRTAHPVKP